LEHAAPGGLGTLVVINCHLEGDPALGNSRLRQAHSALLHAERMMKQHKCPDAHLVVAGDFNCTSESALCTMMRNGRVSAGERDYGLVATDVDMEQPFALECPYELSADVRNLVTFVSVNWCGRIDHVWVSATLAAHAVMHPLLAGQDVDSLSFGRLPNAANPSDHLPLGVALRPVPGASNRRAHPDAREPSTVTEDTARQWLALLDAAPETPAGKPTAEQLEVLREHAAQKKRFLAALTSAQQQELKQLAKKGR
jgi:hypothetical protein